MRYASILKTVVLLSLAIIMSILLVDADYAINDARRDLNLITANLNTSLTSIAVTSRELSDAGAQAALAAKEQRAYWAKTSLETYKTMAAARLTIIRTDRTINDIIAPKLVANLDSVRDVTDTTGASINAVMDQIAPTLINVNRATASAAYTLSDPAIRDSIDNLAKVTDNIAGATADVHTETSLLVAKTRDALTPEAKWKTLVKAVLGNAVTAVEIWYYFTH